MASTVLLLRQSNKILVNMESLKRVVIKKDAFLNDI
jgi:hypothetical protein